VTADVPHPAVPEPDPHQLARGRALTDKLREVESELSAWRDEITADNAHRLLDAEAQSDAAFAALHQARMAIATFTLVVSQGGGR
jgi:hypothetical protein